MSIVIEDIGIIEDKPIAIDINSLPVGVYSQIVEFGSSGLICFCDKDGVELKDIVINQEVSNVDIEPTKINKKQKNTSITDRYKNFGLLDLDDG